MNSLCSLQIMLCNMFGSHSFFFPSFFLSFRMEKAQQSSTTSLFVMLGIWQFIDFPLPLMLIRHLSCSLIPNHSSSPVRSCLARVTADRACCCYLISTKLVNSNFSRLHKSSVDVLVALILHTTASHSVTVCYN